jgi:hypothetical protein
MRPNRSDPSTQPHQTRRGAQIAKYGDDPGNRERRQRGGEPSASLPPEPCRFIDVGSVQALSGSWWLANTSVVAAVSRPRTMEGLPCLGEKPSRRNARIREPQ